MAKAVRERRLVLRPRELLGGGQRAREARELRRGSLQALILRRDGITASDCLWWVYDPEPRALGHEARSINVTADPVGDRITVELCWESEPLDPYAAALAAGFALAPEVVQVVAEEPRAGERAVRRSPAERAGSRTP